MRKLVVVFVAVFCFNSLVLAQEEIKYFEEDNTFYLGSMRLSEHEVRRTLSSNPSALEMWEKGNFAKQNNKAMKTVTGILLISGGVITIVSFTYSVALIPVYLLGGTSNAGSLITLGLVLCGAGVVTAIMIPITKAKYKFRYSESASMYNKGLYKTSASLHIGTTGNGIGFSLKF